MTSKLHPVDNLKRHLNIDAAEIARRKEFFGIDDAIAGRLSDLHHVFADDSAVLSDDFYDHLLDQSELQHMIDDPATLQRLKQSLRRYFLSMTAGTYGESYVNERLRVGLVHLRIGLEPKWYIGAYRIYLSRLLPFLLADGDPARVGATLDALLRLTFFDMSLALESYHGAHLQERTEASYKLEAANADAQDLARTYSAIVNAIPANLALVDETARIVAVNEGWRRFADANGYRDENYGVGLDYRSVCAATYDDGAEHASRIAEGIGAVLRLETDYFAHEYPCHSSTEQRWFRAIVTPLELRGRAGAVVMHVNVTDRKERELTLWRSANYDALTDIPNRVLLLDRLTQAISLARRSDSLVALLFIDFDRFKLVNDLLGHAAGDEILRVIARRLGASLREQDTVGRISGDEFLVVLPNLKRPDEALTVAHKLLTATAQPIDYNGQETFITCSIGIAMAPDDGDDAEQLVRYADAAMYRSKQAGRNHVQFFTGDVQIGSAERLQLEVDLRRALERREFEVHYQPKADIASGRINGAEALLRWRHPTRGLVAPGEFIPLLEETGLVHGVGLWVIEQVCADIFNWQQTGLSPGRIAVNVSPLQLQEEDFVPAVINLLAGTDIPPSALEFEITESYLLHNAETAAARLRELHALGIEIRHRRFRHRLLEYRLSAPTADSHHQDRPLLRPKHSGRSGQLDAGQHHHPDGAPLAPQGRGRGSRGRASARLSRPACLRHPAGLSLFEAAARGAIPRLRGQREAGCRLDHPRERRAASRGGRYRSGAAGRTGRTGQPRRSSGHRHPAAGGCAATNGGARGRRDHRRPSSAGAQWPGATGAGAASLSADAAHPDRRCAERRTATGCHQSLCGGTRCCSTTTSSATLIRELRDALRADDSLPSSADAAPPT